MDLLRGSNDHLFSPCLDLCAENDVALFQVAQDLAATVDHGLRVGVLQFGGDLLQQLFTALLRLLADQLQQPCGDRIEFDKTDLVLQVAIDQQVGRITIGPLRNMFWADLSFNNTLETGKMSI